LPPERGVESSKALSVEESLIALASSCLIWRRRPLSAGSKAG